MHEESKVGRKVWTGPADGSGAADLFMLRPVGVRIQGSYAVGLDKSCQVCFTLDLREASTSPSCCVPVGARGHECYRLQ